MNNNLTKLKYNAAMGEALIEEMRKDDSIFILGQGVATGGWFGAEKGLASEFGEERVIDCGITEAFEAGLACGASIVGMKPVINMGFGDFALIAGDEIYHKLAKWRYMHGTNIPMTAVIILPIGAMGGAGPEHSSSTEVLGMHFPGLKVVVPSNAADAKGLMKAALREPNPVLFHSVNVLGFTDGDVPVDEDFVVPIGSADVVREGDQMTILTYGSMVQRCMQASDTLHQKNISAEVIDLRSLVPLDWDKIIKSVKKTSRVLIVHEAFRSAGPGAEIAAGIMDRAFFDLEAPVLRLGGKDIPLPQNAALEQLCIPSESDIVTESLKLMAL